MTLLESLMRRLGYAKLDKFGLSLAANDRVISHNRKALAMAGDWVVGWRVEDSIVTGTLVNFDAQLATRAALSATTASPARAQTARQEFGSALRLPQNVRAPSAEEGQGIVQTEALIVMQSEPVEAESQDAGETMAMTPSTAQLVAATPASSAPKTTSLPTVMAAAETHVDLNVAGDEGLDDEEWEWMMARARAADQVATTTKLPVQVAASNDEDEAQQWQVAMERARTAVVAPAAIVAPVAAPIIASQPIASGPVTDRDIEIPIFVATPVFSMAAVVVPAVSDVAALPSLRGATEAQPIAPVPAVAASIPAPVPVPVQRPRAAAGTQPAPYAATTTPMPAVTAPLPAPAMRGEPPHLRAATASQPVQLYGHTARLYLGAIPPMPTDATRRTRSTVTIASSSNDADNDPVIAPPRLQTETSAPRLLRPLPPLPGKSFARPQTNSLAPLRPVPRVTRLSAQVPGITSISQAPRRAASEGHRQPQQTRRLATAS